MLSLDVVGYSRMMARDDMSAVAALHEARTLIAQEMRRTSGRLFGSAGDSFMLEFSSALSAVGCAAGIQKAIAIRNQGLPDMNQIWLRAGAAMGSAIDDDGNLFGDVVNIAARLQETCPSGGVLVSGDVRTACGDDLTFRAAGELVLKNIPTPIRTFELLDTGQLPGAIASGPGGSVRRRAIPGLESAAFLAVLPLRNDTGDAGLEPVARGFSEDLIITLSHTRRFPVIDRSSSFAFRSGVSAIPAIAQNLGVRYVVDGDLRGSRDRLEVVIRASEAEFGRLLWEEKFNAEGEALFAALDDIALRVVATLGGELERAEALRNRSRRESRIGARGLVWRSRWHLDQLTRRDSQEALRLLTEARELDPGDPEARIQLAHWHWIDVWTQRRPASDIQTLKDMASAALASDPADSRGHLLVGLADILLKDIQSALVHFNDAVALNPSLALAYAEIGSCRIALGEARSAIVPLELCLRLNPHDYYVFYVLGELAIAHCLLRDWDKALDYARRALRLRPSYWNARMSEATALLHAGDAAGAAHAAEMLFARAPRFSRAFIEWLPFQDKAIVDFFDDAINAARKLAPAGG